VKHRAQDAFAPPPAGFQPVQIGSPFAIHPDQVPVINEAHTPGADERLRAQRIVDALAAQPGAGTLSIDGVTLDKPLCLQALNTLGRPARNG
jgi:citrate lyase beta subunit